MAEAYPSGSLLSDVLESVRDQFAAVPLTTKVLCGQDMVAQNDAPDRIVFVPDDGDPVMAPIRIGTGGVATFTMGCDAHVWGLTEEDADGFQRTRAADIMLRNLVIALFTAAPGRVTLVKLFRNSETADLTHGEEFVLRFTFTYQVNSDRLLPLPENLKRRVALNVGD